MKKKKNKKRISCGPRVQKNTADFLTENFKTLNAGAEYILDSAPALFYKASRMIENSAQAEDLYRLKLAFEEFNLNPQLAGRNLLLALNDKPELLKLIKGLSEAELFWLEIYLKNVVFEEVE